MLAREYLSVIDFSVYLNLKPENTGLGVLDLALEKDHDHWLTVL